MVQYDIRGDEGPGIYIPGSLNSVCNLWWGVMFTRSETSGIYLRGLAESGMVQTDFFIDRFNIFDIDNQQGFVFIPDNLHTGMS